MNKGNIYKLNSEQIKAVRHTYGPLLIIAGAGTGKTTVITERIKYLISKELAKPEEILALTFTEKAASEMESRVDTAMPLSYGDIWIMTFHSFCDRILRNEALQIGLPSNFKLMTEAQSLDLFKKNLFDFNLDYFRPLGNPNKFVGEILKHFSRLQDEVVSPDEYMAWVKGKEKDLNDSKENKLELKKWKELALAYKQYEKLKADSAKFDFGDLIIKTIELFKKRPNILLKYQEKFKYILVDEYQDTNFAQNELVNLLASKFKNITVVGDDNQSIYRFRGAAISNILKFKDTYPAASTITLNRNYRSTQTILDSAYALIKHNDPDTLEARLGISKKLISEYKTKGHEIEFIHTNNVSQEAETITEKIINLTTKPDRHYEYSDIAILVRANNHADPFMRELERRGIPNQFLGPSKLFEKEEVADLIAYLKVLYNPSDSINFYRLISSAVLGVDPLELISITSTAKKKSLEIFEVVMESENENLKKLIMLINKHLSEMKQKTAGVFLYEFLKEFEVYEKILESEDDIKARNIGIFFQKIKDYENQNPATGVREVVDYLDLLTEAGETPMVGEGDWQENNAVNILTVHGAKGLEFPVVFMVNLVNERFPSRSRGDQIPIHEDLIKEELPQGDFHIQEERRLFYVGMTRAKERLFLSASDFYGNGINAGEGRRKKKISPFVAEALGEKVLYELTTTEKTKIEDYQNNNFLRTKIGKSKLKINYLSVSQIETFQTCPLHYALRYIYKLPTPYSASISFGISIHNTLRDFYTSGEKILDIYKENWITEGYENKKHKEEFFKKGEGYLIGFVKNGYNPKTKTIKLEEKFNFKLAGNLTIGGQIDRIDELEDGRYEIIDYKTGANIPTQKDVDRDLQLSVYAMAASSILKVKPEDIKLSLYFLDTQEKISTIRSAKDLEDTKEFILNIREEIETSDFKCSGNYFCLNGCEFKSFCRN